MAFNMISQHFGRRDVTPIRAWSADRRELLFVSQLLDERPNLLSVNIGVEVQQMNFESVLWR